MKKTILTLAAVFFAIANQAAELDINGGFDKVNAKTGRPANWNFNNWVLYRPFPKVQVTAPENESKVLHISDVKGQRGTELCFSKPFPAVAGDTITVTAQVKGKGSAVFGIQLRDAKNNFTGYSKRGGSKKLTGEWKDVKVSFKVTDNKKSPTRFISVTFGCNTGNELFIRNIKAEHTAAAAPAVQ